MEVWNLWRVAGIAASFTAALHCTALHCTVLHCTALHYYKYHGTSLDFFVLHCQTINTHRKFSLPIYSVLPVFTQSVLCPVQPY
jgi:hypothetical protein